MKIIEALLKNDENIKAFDFEVMKNVQGVVGDKIKYAANQYEGLGGEDALIIATEWSEFGTP